MEVESRSICMEGLVGNFTCNLRYVWALYLWQMKEDKGLQLFLEA